MRRRPRKQRSRAAVCATTRCDRSAPGGPGALTKASAALALAGGGGASRHACLVAKRRLPFGTAHGNFDQILSKQEGLPDPCVDFGGLRASLSIRATENMSGDARLPVG